MYKTDYLIYGYMVENGILRIPDSETKIDLRHYKKIINSNLKNQLTIINKNNDYYLGLLIESSDFGWNHEIDHETFKQLVPYNLKHAIVEFFGTTLILPHNFNIHLITAK